MKESELKKLLKSVLGIVLECEEKTKYIKAMQQLVFLFIYLFICLFIIYIYLFLLFIYLFIYLFIFPCFKNRIKQLNWI